MKSVKMKRTQKNGADDKVEADPDLLSSLSNYQLLEVIRGLLLARAFAPKDPPKKDDGIVASVVEEVW